MNNIILGDGITGYVIAACLDYLGEFSVIYGNDSYSPPSILLLKCRNLNELKKYFKIFNIPYNSKNVEEYVRAIKIGYTNDYCKTIVDIPTEEMKETYLSKQFRDNTSTSMSDNLNSFIAIDLKKIYELLKERFKDRLILTKIDKEYFINRKDCTIYNTIFDTETNNYLPSIEYVDTNNTYNIKEYDYVYDCNKWSNIKRITRDYIEYISEPDNYIAKINNYYKEPSIYSITNIKTQSSWVDISRNATHTQLKQEDIINYLVKDE